MVGQFLCGYDARVRGGSQSLFLCKDVSVWVALSGADVDVGVGLRVFVKGMLVLSG